MGGIEHKSARIKGMSQLRAKRMRLTSLLGVFVVAVIAIALMVPGISMTRGELVCDLEEHQHSDACYEQVLVCGYDDESAVEAEHEHGDDCYEDRLVCEKSVHQHSDACYESVQDSGDGEQGADGAGDEGEDDAAGKPKAKDAIDKGSEDDTGDDAGKSVDDNADDGIDYPSVTLEQSLDLDDDTLLEVALDADEGVLPEGVSMKLAKIKKEKAEDTLALMKREADEAGIPADESLVMPFDIQLLDAEGNPVEPAGDGRVTVKHPAIAPDSQFTLVRVKYAEDSEHKDKAAVIELTGADPEDSTIEFEAGVFSPRPYGLVYVPAPQDEEDAEGASDDGEVDEGTEGDSEDANSESSDNEAGNGSSIFIVSGDDEEITNAGADDEDAADADADGEETDSESADGEEEDEGLGAEE